jgi:hypothetical protein
LAPYFEIAFKGGEEEIVGFLEAGETSSPVEECVAFGTFEFDGGGFWGPGRSSGNC